MPPKPNPLEDCTGFDSDEDNAYKNWERHRVTPEEAEQVFFNVPLVIRADTRHSNREKRFYALGRSDAGRLLFAAFTIRGPLVRVISVRGMNRKEQETYARHEKEEAS